MKNASGTWAFRLATLVLASSGATAAMAITPTYTSFGALPAATFNGTNISSGIDNTQVAITVVDGITLGLTATPRFSNPAVTNDGMGTYTAQVGPDTGNPAFAMWNFDFYVDTGVPSTTAPATHYFQLKYDFDPAAANAEADHGVVNFGPLGGPAAGTQWSNSWNLGMGFLAAPSVPITPPTFSPFSNTAAGEYTFALAAFNFQGVEVGRAAIRVNVVPEPATYLMMFAGIGLVVGLARRRGLRRD
jgi:PEP-CTERM motif